jgi:hypothetical protein
VHGEMVLDNIVAYATTYQGMHSKAKGIGYDVYVQTGDLRCGKLSSAASQLFPWWSVAPLMGTRPRSYPD